MKNTLFLSDLHAGSPLFRYHNYLTGLIEDDKYRQIIIVGDIIDTWENSVKNIIKAKYSPIEALINCKKEVHIVKGNHDPDIGTLKNIFPRANVVETFMVIDNIVLVHGDEFDELITKYSKLVKSIYWVHWLLERFGINIKAFFRELVYSVSSKSNKLYYNDLVYDIMDKILMKYGGYGDIIITGHTHMPMISHHPKYPGKRYINCGDWVHNYSYVEYINDDFVLNYFV